MTSMKKYLSHSEKETKNLAKKIARQFKGGQVLGLVGELGSGKTQFVKGLAGYFKIKKNITSPTFVLLKPYRISAKKFYLVRPRASRASRGGVEVLYGKIKYLVHIDCYRLENPQELLDIGVNEYLNNKNCLTVIEWAEKAKSVLPKRMIWVKFQFGKKENERVMTVSSCN